MLNRSVIKKAEVIIKNQREREQHKQSLFTNEQTEKIVRRVLTKLQTGNGNKNGVDIIQLFLKYEIPLAEDFTLRGDIKKWLLANKKLKE